MKFSKNDFVHLEPKQKNALPLFDTQLCLLNFNMKCVLSLSHCRDTVSDTHNLKEDGFILTHSYNLWSAGSKAGGWQRALAEVRLLTSW